MSSSYVLCWSTLTSNSVFNGNSRLHYLSYHVTKFILGLNRNKLSLYQRVMESKTRTIVIIANMQPEANLNDDMHVKLLCVKSNSFIEGRTLAIIEIHSDINLQDIFEKNEVLSTVKKDNDHNLIIKGMQMWYLSLTQFHDKECEWDFAPWTNFLSICIIIYGL